MDNSIVHKLLIKDLDIEDIFIDLNYYSEVYSITIKDNKCKRVTLTGKHSKLLNITFKRNDYLESVSFNMELSKITEINFFRNSKNADNDFNLSSEYEISYLDKLYMSYQYNLKTFTCTEKIINVKHLHIINSSLSFFDSEVNLNALQTLVLQNNELKNIEFNYSMSNLLQLDLADNYINSLKFKTQFKRLELLNLSNLKIEELVLSQSEYPSSFRNLRCLLINNTLVRRFIYNGLLKKLMYFELSNQNQSIYVDFSLDNNSEYNLEVSEDCTYSTNIQNKVLYIESIHNDYKGYFKLS